MNQRQRMLLLIKSKYKLNDPVVFKALQKVPREEFIPDSHKHLAYKDTALPIGYDQTISQPYTVAFMTHLLELKGNEKILEIGTGSGYQAAVLANLAKQVFSIERIKSLADKAKKITNELGYKNIHIKSGRGELGWPRHAPFDRILVTANLSDSIPPVLLDQLKENGILVAPIRNKMIRLTAFGTFRFVPFVLDR